MIWKEYQRLPFSARNAARFLAVDINERYNKVIWASDVDNWNTYAPLLEKSNGMVAQAEDTIYIHKDLVEIMTYGRDEN
jgi:methionine aminopeptidase